MRIKLAYKKTTACELYRLILPARALDHHEFVHDDNHRVQLDADGNVKAILGDLNFDIVVFPRATHKLISQIIEKLQARGIVCVVEMDDDLKTISPHHKGWAYFQHHNNETHNWKNAQRAAKAANWVTVTTDALAERYGSHGRVSIIPNYVPDYFIQEGEKKEFGKRIIWGGMLASHPGDLKTMGSSIAQLQRQDDEVTFEHVGQGDADKEINILNYNFHGACSLEEWPYAINQKGDIGVAPVEQSQFNESKSWLKPLEYAALGLPFVAGPSTPYQQFVNKGCGTIANKPRKWYNELKRLTTDEDYWWEQHEAGLAVARENVISKNAWRWEEAWHKARAA